MANNDSPFGLRPIKNAHGGTIQVNEYYIPSSYGTALYIGDPVVKTGTANTSGYLNRAAGTLPEINKATAGDGNAITGVIVGFVPLADNLSKQYNPASTERIALVCDDPYQLFEIQADSAGTLAATSIGLNAVLIYTHSGSTTTGWSGAELDTTSDAPAADASNQLTILRFVDRPDNEIGVHAKVVVRINNHTEAHASIGI